MTLIVVLVCYFGLVVAIGIWSAFHTKTEEDFLAAGRTIGPFVGGAVLAATHTSSPFIIERKFSASFIISSVFKPFIC